MNYEDILSQCDMDAVTDLVDAGNKNQRGWKPPTGQYVTVIATTPRVNMYVSKKDKYAGCKIPLFVLEHTITHGEFQEMSFDDVFYSDNPFRMGQLMQLLSRVANQRVSTIEGVVGALPLLVDTEWQTEVYDREWKDSEGNSNVSSGEIRCEGPVTREG